MGLLQAVIEIGIDPYVELGPVSLAWHGPSGSFARTLRRRGRYRLICTIHGGRRQSMRIRVR
jgi:hypothetical protein